MPYYWLNKCPKEKLDEVSKYCEEIGLENVITKFLSRQWVGRNYKIICTVSHDENNVFGYPLVVQTWGNQEYTENSELKGILKKLVGITKSNQICEGFPNLKELDISFLE